jgi:hypothetical protein
MAYGGFLMAEEIEAFELNEEVWGTLKCYAEDCGYRGRMEGIIQYNNRREIIFICPKCKTIERIKNPDFNQ